MGTLSYSLSFIFSNSLSYYDATRIKIDVELLISLMLRDIDAHLWVQYLADRKLVISLIQYKPSRSRWGQGIQCWVLTCGSAFVTMLCSRDFCHLGLLALTIFGYSFLWILSWFVAFKTTCGFQKVRRSRFRQALFSYNYYYSLLSQCVAD